MSNPTPTGSHCRRCGEVVPAAASECPRCGTPTGPPMPSRDAPGGILDGKWALERELGKGAMGTVWLATDLELERKVAIKMLAARYAADAGLVARFEREARMMARLDHPNLVSIYAVGRQDGVHFIVMKLLDGKTLGDTLQSRGKLPLDEVVAIVRQLCLGLQFIHQRGVVHRDIKPANVFLAPDGHVTLLDLGVARDTQSNMTVAGAMVGTPRYMSPEQVLGKRADHRADLYALAALTYELSTGVPPFDGDTGVSLLKAHLDTPPPDASHVAPLPPAVGATLVKGLAKKPEDRFQSASELCAALKRAARDEPRQSTHAKRIAVAATDHSAVPKDTQLIPAPSPPIASRARTGVGFRRQPWWLLGSLVGLATLGGLGALLDPREASPPSAPPVELATANPAHVETEPAKTDESQPSPTPTTVEPRAAMPSSPAETTPLLRRTDSPPVRPERRHFTQEEDAAVVTTTSEPEAKPTPGTPPLAPPTQPAATWAEKRPATAPTPTPPMAALKTRPKRVAFNGKLLTEAETERSFAARDTGATEADALQISVGTPVGPASTPLPRRVAYNGHLLNDAESRHYFAARDAGLDHEAAARAAQKEAPAATAKPLYRGPLPANLPKRVAINGKLLSVEETEQYFREKLARNPPGDH